jgi:hypothetical protein
VQEIEKISKEELSKRLYAKKKLGKRLYKFSKRHMQVQARNVVKDWMPARNNPTLKGIINQIQ